VIEKEICNRKTTSRVVASRPRHRRIAGESARIIDRDDGRVADYSMNPIANILSGLLLPLPEFIC